MRLTWSNYVKLSILDPKCLRHLLGVWRPVVATKISKLSICLTLSNDLPWNKVSNFGLPSTHQNDMHSVNSNTQFQRSLSFPSIPKSADPGRRAQSSSSYVESKICHKIQNPKSPNSKIQNPKSKIPKIPKIQNPKSPKFGALGASHKDLLHNGPKSKIQNPQNPKSKIPKIQNPKSPKSKIQNPQDPKSKIRNPQIQIQNPQNPKSKIPEIWGHIKICYITVQNPKSKIPKIGQKSLDFGLGDFGFWISAPKSKIQNPQDPKSKIPKIQNPKSPKSKIQNPKSPRSKIQNPQNPQNPKSSAKIQNLGRWGPHIKICYISIQNPKSKIPKIHYGHKFWILDLGILDFGFWPCWPPDFGAFGEGQVAGCTTRQFGDGAWRSEARIPPGPPFRDSAKPTLSDIVGARKQIELQKPGAQEVKTIFYTFLHDF